MKRISLEQLIEESGEEGYLEQYAYVRGLLESKRIKAVKSSPGNGKKPALYTSYWLVEEAPDFGELTEELKYGLVPSIRTDYYLAHPESYRKEQKWVRLLNAYLLECRGTCQPEASVNERSFQIWGREKFLSREQGRKILAHCGISMEQLSVYATTEPLAYYSAHRRVPQNILILENKDTFYTMRRWLLQGAERILGEEIGTLVYGAGKGILRSYEDFRLCVEPHMKDVRNRIYYFGDLDYEGLRIYEQLEALFGQGAEDMPRVAPFVPAYERMLAKAYERGIKFLPETSENQNRNLTGRFYRFFPGESIGRMEEILGGGKYIPQEILTITDLE